MARIADSEIERIKAEVSLVRLVESSGVKLARKGKDELAGCCPFHADDTPSLSVSVSKNLFRCFGCDAGGGPIDWVMKREGMSLRHAVEWLRADAPGGAPVAPGPETAKPRHSGRRLPSPVRLDADDAALLAQVVDYYHDSLKQSPEALAYLAARGLDGGLVERFRLGYANRTLGLRLPEKNRKAGADIRGKLERIGIYRASGHEHFTGSLVVPVIDEAGRICEVYGRKIRNDLRPGTPLHLYLPGPHAGVWNIEGIAGSGRSRSGVAQTGAGDGTAAQPIAGAGGGQVGGSASGDAQPGDIVVTARRGAGYNPVSAAVVQASSAGSGNGGANLPYLVVDDHRSASSFAELDSWEANYRDIVAKNGRYSNSDELEAAFAYNRQMLEQGTAMADAEVNKLLFAGVGAPALLAGGGAVAAPLAGAYAMSLGGGGLAYYGTSFAVGGVAGGGFEYSKNSVFGLQGTVAGYAGSILGGGIGGTGWQVLGRGAPVLLNNIVTGGILGSGGDFVGQEIDMRLGNRTTLDGRSILVSGGIGAAAGGAVSLEVRVNGLNAGRNNSLSIYNGLQTRMSTGNISQFRPRYGVAGGLGQGLRGVGQRAASSVYVGIYQDANR